MQTATPDVSPTSSTGVAHETQFLEPRTGAQERRRNNEHPISIGIQTGPTAQPCPEGKSFACKLVGYQTAYSALKSGDYPSCVLKYFDVVIKP